MANKKFITGKSFIDGTGVFAVRAIKKGEPICRMDGERISIPELKKRYRTGEERLSDPLQVGEGVYIDLFEPFLYVNHSCDPNAAVVGTNELVAIKDITSGQEITYDYSMTEWSEGALWEGYDEWLMECKCGSSFCRKKIGEFYLLPKEIQEQSIKQGKTQNFIAEKYNARK